MNIRDAKSFDYEGIKRVQKITWLATYSDKKHGITREEIEARFNQPPRRPIEESKKAIEGDKNSHYWVAEETTSLSASAVLCERMARIELAQSTSCPSIKGKVLARNLFLRE